MAILTALGIDITVLFQFVISGFAFFALTTIVFAPYAKALLEREKRTKGGEVEAAQIIKDAAELKGTYEHKARELAGEIKTIFDSYRLEANKEYDRIVTQAREASQKMMEETRKRVTAEIVDETQKLKEEIPNLAQTMAKRLLVSGKG